MASDSLPDHVKAIFLSDLHLGYCFSTGANCVAVLEHVRAEKIFLVGDNFDETRLRLHWHWSDEEQSVIDKLLELHNDETEIFLLPGNHDPCFRDRQLFEQNDEASKRVRQLLQSMLQFHVADRFDYETINGQRLLIIHGDQFDEVESHLFGIPKMGSRIFDRYNWLLPRAAVLGLRQFFKMLFAKPNQIEESIFQHAREHGYDGVFYGHLHDPKLLTKNGLVVANCGDWLGNESFLVETLAGELKLFNFQQEIRVL